MPDLKLNITAQIPSGPAVSLIETLKPEGYGLTSVRLPHNSGNIKVRLAAETLDLLLITSDKYSTAPAKISIEAGTGAAKRSVELTRALLLSGGATSLLDHKGEITLKNEGTTAAHDAVVSILSAGDVTPP